MSGPDTSKPYDTLALYYEQKRESELLQPPPVGHPAFRGFVTRIGSIPSDHYRSNLVHALRAGKSAVMTTAVNNEPDKQDEIVKKRKEELIVLHILPKLRTDQDFFDGTKKSKDKINAIKAAVAAVAAVPVVTTAAVPVTATTTTTAPAGAAAAAQPTSFIVAVKRD